MMIKMNVIMPVMPNFLRLVGANLTVGVGELSDDEIKTFTEVWTKKFIAHAVTKKQQLKKDNK